MTQHGSQKATDAVRTRASGGGSRGPTRSAKTKIVEIVAVCTQCAKRQGLRKGDVRRRLKRAAGRAKEARTAGDTAKGLKIRVVETGCLGPCPKRALAVATGASLAARRILLLDPDADEAEIAATLLPACGVHAAAIIDRDAALGLPSGARSCDDRASRPSDQAPVGGKAGESPTA